MIAPADPTRREMTDDELVERGWRWACIRYGWHQGVSEMPEWDEWDVADIVERMERA